MTQDRKLLIELLGVAEDVLAGAQDHGLFEGRSLDAAYYEKRLEHAIIATRQLISPIPNPKRERLLGKLLAKHY